MRSTSTPPFDADRRQACEPAPCRRQGLTAARDRQRRAIGWLCVAATTLLWGTSRIWMKWLTGSFDSYTQNFYRYLFAALVVWTGILCFRRNGLSLSRGDVARLARPALMNALMQIISVEAIYYIPAGLAMLLSRFSLVVSAILAYFLIPQERWVLLSKRFALGMALLLIGTGGLAGGFGIRPESGFAWGVGLAIVGSVSWGCYSVDVKGILDRCDPLSAFGVISLYTLAFVAIPAFAVGHPGRIFSAGWGPFWMAALSGAACIGAGHVTYLAAISILGATRAIWVTSMAPAVTAVLSAGVFGEAFPPLKAAAAALTVLGAAVIAMPRFLPARTPPDEAGG